MITYTIDVLLAIGIIYMSYILYQLFPYYINQGNNSLFENNKNNDNYDDNDNDNDNINNNKIGKTENVINHFESSIMPITKHGFHDHFAKLNGYENNQHLGWRYWYLKNKTDYMVKPTDNFDNIKNFLDKLDNTHNWFNNLSEMTDIEDFVIE